MTGAGTELVGGAGVPLLVAAALIWGGVVAGLVRIAALRSALAGLRTRAVIDVDSGLYVPGVLEDVVVIALRRARRLSTGVTIEVVDGSSPDHGRAQDVDFPDVAVRIDDARIALVRLAAGDGRSAGDGLRSRPIHAFDVPLPSSQAEEAEVVARVVASIRGEAEGRSGASEAPR